MRPRPIILAIVVLGAVTFLAWWLLPNDEPRYLGKPLSYWLKPLSFRPLAIPIEPSEEEEAMAAKAITAIGTNAVPHLLKWMTFTNQPTKADIVYNELAYNIHPRWVSAGDYWKGESYRMFRILGTNATSAVPQLEHILMTGDVVIGQRAAVSLAFIGLPAIPSLRSGLTNQNSHARRNSIIGLRLVSEKLPSFKEDIAKMVSDPNESVRRTATNALVLLEALSRSSDAQQ